MTCGLCCSAFDARTRAQLAPDSNWRHLGKRSAGRPRPAAAPKHQPTQLFLPPGPRSGSIIHPLQHIAWLCHVKGKRGKTGASHLRKRCDAPVLPFVLIYKGSGEMAKPLLVRAIAFILKKWVEWAHTRWYFARAHPPRPNARKDAQIPIGFRADQSIPRVGSCNRLDSQTSS
jgi:hypothetical protein